MERGVNVRHWYIVLGISAATLLTQCLGAQAAFQMGTTEELSWSDMAFTGVTGGYSTSTKQLTASGSSNDLEIGGQFGPGFPGRHYGTGGTLGGPFSSTLTMSGVIVQSNGNVTNGGTVSIAYNSGAPGSIGTDYGIPNGSVLLTGSVAGLQLNATGSGTLDVMIFINGGALQNNNPSLGTNFAPGLLGLMRFGSRTPINGDFTTGFSLGSATLDLFGSPIPEPQYATFLCFGALFSFMFLARSVNRQPNGALPDFLMFWTAADPTGLGGNERVGCQELSRKAGQRSTKSASSG